MYRLTKVVLASEISVVLNRFKNCLNSLSKGDEYINQMADKIAANGTVICISDNSKIIGFIAFYSNDMLDKIAYITMIAVLPEYRGKSIGEKLLLECMEISAMNGMTAIKLEVNKNNESAIHFYEKHGFQFFNECSENSIYMQRNITEVNYVR